MVSTFIKLIPATERRMPCLTLRSSQIMLLDPNRTMVLGHRLLRLTAVSSPDPNTLPRRAVDIQVVNRVSTKMSNIDLQAVRSASAVPSAEYPCICRYGCLIADQVQSLETLKAAEYTRGTS